MTTAIAIGRDYVRRRQRTMYSRRDMVMNVALMRLWGRCDWRVRRVELEQVELEHKAAWLGSTERAR
jgi:hypothetical protein